MAELLPKLKGLSRDEQTRVLVDEVWKRPLEQRFASEQATGEWVVYVPRDGRNYYLTTSKHCRTKQEQEQMLSDILAVCTIDFPTCRNGSPKRETSAVEGKRGPRAKRALQLLTGPLSGHDDLDGLRPLNFGRLQQHPSLSGYTVLRRHAPSDGGDDQVLAWRQLAEREIPAGVCDRRPLVRSNGLGGIVRRSSLDPLQSPLFSEWRVRDQEHVFASGRNHASADLPHESLTGDRAGAPHPAGGS